MQDHQQEWKSYLLPAGTSETLHARISQTIDLDWGNSTEHLEEIMDNQVPSKLFDGKTVLCLSPCFVPPPTKKVRPNVSPVLTNPHHVADVLLA